MSISLVMIVKNEESCLKKCLESVVSLVEEMIIVDTGSEDKTEEIVAEYTKNILHYPWDNDFSKARNFGIAKASSPWILVLDADEMIYEKGCAQIKELVKDTSHEGYLFTQRSYTADPYKYDLSSKADSDGYFDTQHIRLFKNKYRYSGKVYEVVTIPYGKVSKSGIVIHHQGHTDTKFSDKKMGYYRDLWKKSIQKNDAPVQVYQYYLGSGIEHEREFTEVFQKAVHEYGFNLELFNVLIAYFLKNGRYEEGLAWLTSNSEMTYQWIMSSQLNAIKYAFAYFKNGNNSKAKELLKKFINDDDDES